MDPKTDRRRAVMNVATRLLRDDRHRVATDPGDRAANHAFELAPTSVDSRYSRS
jgi:hypothetical protein